MAHSSPADRALRSVLLLVVATLLCALGAGAFAPPAHAHSALVSSVPADGEEVPEAPAEVVLTFNEDIEALGTEVAVTDAAGADVSDGETVIEGPNVSRALPAERPAGAYTVTWRAVSADGHPISGEFTFTATSAVGAPEPTQEPTTAEPTEEPTTAEPTDATDDGATAGESDDGVSTGLKVAIFVIAAVAILGGILVRIVLMRRARS